MLFNIALNYGGRAEIVDAARRAIAAGIAADDLDERRFGEFLYTAGQPDPDLLIRTSGEMRVSNFLLWQIAYAEIWVTETLWPDFRRRAPARGRPRLPEARPPLRRHQAVAASRSAPSDARSERRGARRRRRRRRLVRARRCSFLPSPKRCWCSRSSNTRRWRAAGGAPVPFAAAPCAATLLTVVGVRRACAIWIAWCSAASRSTPC